MYEMMAALSATNRVVSGFLQVVANHHHKFDFLILICAALILCTGCANQDYVAEPTKHAGSDQSLNLIFESAKTDFSELPGTVIRESKDTLLRSDNLTALLLATGASIAMGESDADDNLAENFERHRVFKGFLDESLNIIGSPGFHFPATGLWYALSAADNDEFNKDRAWTMMTALSVTGLTTVSLKAIVHNDSPNGKDWAWPSGHTSSSFTVASVLHEFYGPEVGIPAYLMASLVAYRMMDTGDHWGSDVVFGATLGWVVGHTIAGKHKDLEVGGFTVLPYAPVAYGPALGATLVKRF